MTPQTRIAKISVSDYRAFPAGPACVFDLTQDGNNLLLFGENGSGKTSLFRALKDLMAVNPGPTDFAKTLNVYSSGQEGAISTVLTAGQPPDCVWQYGGQHPRETDGAPYRSFAQRFWFLDYKDILRTNYDHEGQNEINVFQLLVENILDCVKLPDGETVSARWQNVLHLVPSEPPPDTEDEGGAPADGREQVVKCATKFADELDGILNLPHIGIVVVANRFLEQLAPGLHLHLTVQPLQLIEQSANPRAKPHSFLDPCILLEATLAGHRVKVPPAFLNEARLTAIGIVLYLAAAKTAIPTAGAGSSPVLVLDDVLIGLDMANRLPVLRLLVEEFADWQIILMTYDRVWFELAKDHLPPKKWITKQLSAKLMPKGWEIPVLLDDQDHLVSAWKYIQAGDFSAAGVYLRTAFEFVLKGFCEERQLALPFRKDTRDYTTEDYWPHIRNFEVKNGHSLVDKLLVEEITVCRKYVLNPLCHNDPGRPNREEVRSAYAAIQRLKTLLSQQLFWRKDLDSRLCSTVKPLIGDNVKLREKALKGLAPATAFALMCACQLLKGTTPILSDIACLIRSAFDSALWDFACRKRFEFTLKCDVPLTTAMLWQTAADGAGGLRTTQMAFVTAIEAHRDLMLDDAPCRDVLEVKGKPDLEQLAITLRGKSPADDPKCVLAGW